MSEEGTSMKRKCRCAPLSWTNNGWSSVIKGTPEKETIDGDQSYIHLRLQSLNQVTCKLGYSRKICKIAAFA